MLLERIESDHWINGDVYTAADIVDLPYDVDRAKICKGLQGVLAELQIAREE